MNKKYGCLYQQTEEFKKLASSQFYEKHKCEKIAKGQRDAYYNKLKNMLIKTAMNYYSLKTTIKHNKIKIKNGLNIQ